MKIRCRHLPRLFLLNSVLLSVAVFGGWTFISPVSGAEHLLAGAARRDITDYDAGPVNDPLFVKALVIRSEVTTVVIVTVDAVAIGEIGRIGNDFLAKVRGRLEKELQIPPENLLVNASHCHGVVLPDITNRTFEAIQEACKNLEPVRVGTGAGQEKRIMENRRLRLKNGEEIDVRHAYSLPPDAEVESVGPTDPEIGILRIDRMDGSTLAVVYNFACHPIQGVPGGANTADLVGFASKVIEENLGEERNSPPENKNANAPRRVTTALFLQGCGGDINPINYKAVQHPRDAEVLGNRLGLSTLRATRKIKCTDSRLLTIHSEKLALPRGDRTARILSLTVEQERLLKSLRGTSLNLKNFMSLMIQHGISPEYPSANAHRYLQEKSLGKESLKSLDAENRRNVKAYLHNIHTMEKLTRLKTNLALLKKHQANMIASKKRTIDVEVAALRVGDFRLITFPGELTVQIGLNLKKKSGEPNTFVSAYTNGYIYYAPTSEQMKNLGGAQEDSDCVLAPEWQPLFENKALELLRKL